MAATARWRDADGAYQMKVDLDFLKDRYDYQLQWREQLTAALTLPALFWCMFDLGRAYHRQTMRFG